MAHEEQGAAGEQSSGSCAVAWCPVCTAVGVVQPLAPEVITHLLKAGSELFLAFRAVIDQRGDEVAGTEQGSPVRLEKIDIG
jgi:hypothetical protein